MIRGINLLCRYMSLSGREMASATVKPPATVVCAHVGERVRYLCPTSQLQQLRLRGWREEENEAQKTRPWSDQAGDQGGEVTGQGGEVTWVSISAEKPSASRVTNCQATHELFKTLELHTGSDSVSRGLKLHLGPERLHLEHGFILRVRDSDVITDVLKRHDVIEHESYAVKDGKLLRQTLCARTGEILNEADMCYLAAPPIYPTMTSPEVSTLFADVREAVKVLEELGTPEAHETLSIYSEHAHDDHRAPMENLRHKFIVVEGLDGLGKTTLTSSLSTHLGAELLKTPPECLRKLRAHFDAQPELIRRAFYTIGNDVVSRDVRRVTNERPVIMDRFWHSTAAYTIATECAGGDETVLPPRGHWCYCWPEALVKPSLVLLLTAPEAVREQRIAKRQEVLTDEEGRLRASSNFRRRLKGAYVRMKNPTPIELDASTTKDEVLAKALEILNKN